MPHGPWLHFRLRTNWDQFHWKGHIVQLQNNPQLRIWGWMKWWLLISWNNHCCFLFFKKQCQNIFESGNSPLEMLAPCSNHSLCCGCGEFYTLQQENVDTPSCAWGRGPNTLPPSSLPQMLAGKLSDLQLMSLWCKHCSHYLFSFPESDFFFSPLMTRPSIFNKEHMNFHLCLLVVEMARMKAVGKDCIWWESVNWQKSWQRWGQGFAAPDSGSPHPWYSQLSPERAELEACLPWSWFR